VAEHFLITGGAGFIGGHLCQELVHSGHTVVAIDDLSTGRLENIAHLDKHPNFQFVRETILNAQVLDRLTSQADTIIHLAAAVGVKLIVEDPVHTIHTNILGSEMVLPHWKHKVTLKRVDEGTVKIEWFLQIGRKPQ